MQGQADGSIIIDTELNSEGFEAGSSELLAAIRSLSNEIKTLSANLKEAFSTSLTPEVNTSGAESNVSVLEAHIKELEAELEQLQQASSQAGEATQATGIGGATQKASELQRQIDAVNTSVERLEPTAQRAMSGSESAMATFEGKAAALETKIAELQEKLDTIAQTKYPTEEYESVCAELDKLDAKFEQLVQRQEKMQALGVNENSTQWQSLQYDMELVGAKYDELLEKKRQFESSGTAFQLGADTTQFTQMETALSSANSRLAEMRSGTSKANGLVRRLGSAAASVASYIGRAARWTTGKLVSGIKSAASNMLKLLSHSKSTKNQFSGLISGAKKFTLSLLGARGVYALLRKAVSAYMSENEELSNTLNSVWSGIGNLLGPIITKLINLVAQAAAYVTKFMNLFGVFGKNTSKSVNKATSDAEKLERTLASFDELNILSDENSDKDSDDDSNKTTSLPDVTLPDWAKEIANQIKAGDWAGAATTLANKLNDMVDSVDWPGLGTKVGKLIHGVLTFLATFIKTFDWQNLGAKLGTFLTNLIKNVNWGNLGVLLVAKWKILLELLVGFFEKLDGKAVSKGLHDLIMGAINACDWVGLMGKLATNLSKFITDIDWKQLGKDLSRGFRTILQAAANFIEKFDWSGVGKSLGNFVNGVDWGGILSDLIRGIAGLINGITSFIINFVETVDWVKLAKDIANAIKNAVKSIKWKDIGKAISGILTSAFKFAFTLVSEIDFGELLQDILDGIGEIIENLDLVEILKGLGALIVSLVAQIPGLIVGALGGIFDIIGSIFEALGLDGIAGFFKGIGDALRNVGKWLKENLVDPVVNWVKNLFGIHSPSTVFAEIGGNLIQGLLNGIEAVWTKIKEFFSAAFSALTTFVSNAWKGVENTFGAFGESFINVFSAARNGIESAWSGVGNFFQGVYNSIYNVFSGIGSWFSSIFQNAVSGIKTAWDGIATWFQTLWEGICAIIKAPINAIISGFNGIIDGLNSISFDIPDWVPFVGGKHFGIDLGHIPELAKGGVLKKGQVGFLEGDGAEAVVPLERNTGWINRVAEQISNCLNRFKSTPILQIHDFLSTIVSGIKNVAQYFIRSLDEIATRLAGNAKKTYAENHSITIPESFSITLKNISEMINRAGGLKMPQVATGSIVPAKCSSVFSELRDYMSDTDSKDKMSMSELKQIIAEIINELNSNEQVTNLVIDGETFFSWIVKKVDQFKKVHGYSPF